jgi:hypothetical protein
MINDWLKLKIIRDTKKLKKFIYPGVEYNRFKSNLSQEYKNIISLSRNTINLQHFNNILPSYDISISNLNKIDFDFLLKISKLENVIIVDTPSFMDFEIIDDNLHTIQRCVNETNQYNTYEFINKYDKYIFYIYIIDNNYVRWYMKEDRYYYKRLQMKRREKLQKIEREI